MKNNCCLCCCCCCNRYCLFLWLCMEIISKVHTHVCLWKTHLESTSESQVFCNCWSNSSSSSSSVLEIPPVVVSISLPASLLQWVHISATCSAVKFRHGLLLQDAILDLVTFSLQQQTNAFLVRNDRKVFPNALKWLASYSQLFLAWNRLSHNKADCHSNK